MFFGDGGGRTWSIIQIWENENVLQRVGSIFDGR